MESQNIEPWDVVSIVGADGEWTVTGTRSDGLFEVQFGKDAATKKFVSKEKLVLVCKPKAPDFPPGFYPSKSIMDM